VVAFWVNRAAHDRSFSALLSSTRDTALARIFNPDRLGKLPLPDDVAKTPLRSEEMGEEGGLGLKLIEAELVGDEPEEDEPAENELAEDEPEEDGAEEGEPVEDNPVPAESAKSRTS
jgi:hypothetical protein